MRDPRFAKFVLLINCLVPLALLIWDAARGRLTDPVDFATTTTGMLTLIFLLLSLAVTPVRKISGWNWLSHFRRMLGLFAFFYALLHLLIYFVFDRAGRLNEIVSDVVNRPFIFFGMFAFLLLVPLAVTSTNGMIKRLGAARWKRLHQLAYVAAIAGIVHFWMAQKSDITEPLIYAIVLALLLGYRLVTRFAPKAPPKPVVRA